MANPSYPEGPATMFYCGDNAKAKDAPRQLAADMGVDPIDAGPLSEARQLEAMAMPWIHLAMRGMGFEHCVQADAALIEGVVIRLATDKDSIEVVVPGSFEAR